jgi:hypothetical protein
MLVILNFSKRINKLLSRTMMGMPVPCAGYLSSFKFPLKKSLVYVVSIFNYKHIYKISNF